MEVLEKGPMAGYVFENYVIAEIVKNKAHTNRDLELYYYRSNGGLEADMILLDKKSRALEFIEIKHNETAKYKMTENLRKIMKTADKNNILSEYKKKCLLVYKGSENDSFSDKIHYINYRDYLRIE